MESVLSDTNIEAMELAILGKVTVKSAQICCSFMIFWQPHISCTLTGCLDCNSLKGSRDLQHNCSRTASLSACSWTKWELELCCLTCQSQNQRLKKTLTFHQNEPHYSTWPRKKWVIILVPLSVVQGGGSVLWLIGHPAGQWMPHPLWSSPFSLVVKRSKLALSSSFLHQRPLFGCQLVRALCGVLSEALLMCGGW